MGGLRYLYRQNNYNYEGLPGDCWVDTNGIESAFSTAEATNTLVNGWVGTVGGMEKFTFVKVAFDSYVGGTNSYRSNIIHYTLPILTNYTQRKLTVWRTNGLPDIIFTSANLLNGSLSVTTSDAQNTDPPFTNTYGISPGNALRADNTSAMIVPAPLAVASPLSVYWKFSTRTWW